MKGSIDFYRDVLGLPLKFESPDWTEFATEATTLALHAAVAGSREPSALEHHPAGSCHPGFQVDDIEAFHQKMSAQGVRCIRPPKQEEFGGKLAVYADPDGLPISISETVKEHRQQ